MAGPRVGRGRTKRGWALVLLGAVVATTFAWVGLAQADPPTPVGLPGCDIGDEYDWCDGAVNVVDVDVDGVFTPGGEIILTMTPNLPYCRTNNSGVWSPSECIRGYDFVRPIVNEGITSCLFLEEEAVLGGDTSDVQSAGCLQFYRPAQSVPSHPEALTESPLPCRTFGDFQFVNGAPAPDFWADVAPGNEICIMTVAPDFVRYNSLPGAAWAPAAISVERCSNASGCIIENVSIPIPIDGDLTPGVTESFELIDEDGNVVPAPVVFEDIPIVPSGETFTVRRTVTVNQGSDLTDVMFFPIGVGTAEIVSQTPAVLPDQLPKSSTTIIEYELRGDEPEEPLVIWPGGVTGVDDTGVERDSDLGDSLLVRIQDIYDRANAPGPTTAIEILDEACTALTTGPISGGDVVTFRVSNTEPGAPCPGIPAAATAVYANVIVEGPTREGNLRLTAAGTAPLGGIVNFGANGLENSNAQSVPLGTNGSLQLSVNGGAGGAGVRVADGATVEILGWFGTDATLGYVPITPCAVFDTRLSQGGSGPLSADAIRSLDIVGTFPASQGGLQTDCGVPTNARGALVNVVALGTDDQMTISSADTGARIVSNRVLNVEMANSSAVTLPIVNESISLDIGLSGTSAEARAVVLGYYVELLAGDADVLGYVALPPCAVFDTRVAQGPLLGGVPVSFQITGDLPSAQGPQSPDCGLPLGIGAVELNVVAVNAIRQGNFQISPFNTLPQGGSLTFASLNPKMNNSNAIVMGINERRIRVVANGGPSANFLQITDVRGVATGYWVPFD